MAILEECLALLISARLWCIKLGRHSIWPLIVERNFTSLSTTQCFVLTIQAEALVRSTLTHLALCNRLFQHLAGSQGKYDFHARATKRARCGTRSESKRCDLHLRAHLIAWIFFEAPHVSS